MPARMATISKLANAGEGAEKREPSALLLGMHAGAAAVEKTMEFPQKIKSGTPI